MSATVSPSPNPDISNHNISSQAVRRKGYQWLSVCAAGLVALASIAYPAVRIFFNLRVGYNEGWNVYNAAKVTHRIPLYGQRYSWTPVNYPALSFHIISWLHRLGFGYLLTGRVLSLLALLASAFFVGLIVWKLSGDRRAAAFASFFCLAVFCNLATVYVGMDDPQILAQAFFMAGLLVYISGPPGWRRLGAVSLLFIVGGNIKHNLVGFPIAVLVDLFFVSRRKVAEYVAISGVLLGVSIAANMWADGPYFISQILEPRPYSVHLAVSHFVYQLFEPLQILLIVAAVWTIKALRDTRFRVIAILFWLTLLVGVVFSGGVGVDVNTYFDLFLSVSIIIGLSLHWFWESNLPGLNLAWKVILPLVLFLSLVPSWFSSNHTSAIRALPMEQEQFQAEVTFLTSQPGIAICENLLLCYEAGKPYEVDPFNSTLLVDRGDLNQRPLIEKLQRGEIGAVELSYPVTRALVKGSRFTPAFIKAVASRYTLAFGKPDCYFYVPKTPVSP